MLNAIAPSLERPALYAKTQAPFWNDEHISQGMLAAHLDPAPDATSRKPDFIDRSVTWILSLLAPRASPLDIGCGPRLYTRRFVQGGLHTTGLDLSARSIAYAREHDSVSDYRVLDYLAMEFEALFDTVTLIWCDYGALVPADRTTLLARVHRALKPGVPWVAS